METLRLCVLAFVCISAVSPVKLEETDLSCYTCSDTVITVDEESTRNEVADLYPPHDAACRNAVKEKMAIKKCYIPSNLGKVPKCSTETTVMNGISPESDKIYSVNILKRSCSFSRGSMDDQCFTFTPTEESGELIGVSGIQCYCSPETCNNVPGSSPDTPNTPITPDTPTNGQTTLSPRTVSYFLGVAVAVYPRYTDILFCNC